MKPRFSVFLRVFWTSLALAGSGVPNTRADSYVWGGPNNQGGNGDFGTAGWDDNSVPPPNINMGPPGGGDSAYIPDNTVLTCSGGGVMTLAVSTSGGGLNLGGGFSVTNLGSIALTGTGNLTATNLQPVSVSGTFDSAERVTVAGAHITINNFVQGNLSVSAGGSGVVKGNLPAVSAATVTDAMSTMEIDGSMSQGSAANGAKFTAGSIANNGISTSAVTADGANTVFSVTGTAEFDGKSFSITNGATAAIGGNLQLYTHQQSSLGSYGGGAVFLDGAGSTLTVGGATIVNAGPSPTDPRFGSISATNGAVLHTKSVIIDGSTQGGGTNQLSGVGSGAQMQIDAGLAVGVTASAGFSITGGAGVTMTGTTPVLALGLSTGGQGQLTISGAGSFLNASDTLVSVAHAANTKGDLALDTNASLVVGGTEPPYLRVGDAGTGTMEVGGGATVQVLGALTTFEVGSQAGSSGSAGIGAGSTLTLTGPAIVGKQGTGTLSISGSGSSATMGSNLTVGGDGDASPTTGNGQIGVSGGGQLTVGTSTAQQVSVGDGAGGVGEIFVADAGSSLVLNGLVIAGLNGLGELAAVSGATAESHGLGLGASAGAAGALLVYNSGTVWTEHTGLVVGSGAGTEASGVAVNDGGLLRIYGKLFLKSNGVVTVTRLVPSDAKFPYPPAPTTSTPNGRVFVGTDNFGPDGAVRVGTGGLLKGKGKQGGKLNINVIGKVVIGKGGRFQPGGDPDVFSVDGDVDLTDGGAGGGETDFEIGGAGVAGTDYDQLQATGTVTLGGTLNLTLLPGYTPKVGDTFNFVQAGAVTGSFTQVVAPGLTVNPVAGSGGLSVTVTTVTVAAVPVVTSATAATAYVGTAFSYQIAATNSPAGYTATGLPDGLEVDAATGLISGAATTAGTYSVALSATNTGGTGTATLSLTVSAAPAAGAPVITSAGTATGQAGTAFSYQIAAANGPTSFGASGLPAGLSVDTSSGSISGTPTAAGTFSVTLSAANASGTGTATLTLTVSSGLPVVTLTALVPSVSVNSGQMGEYLLTLSSPATNDIHVAYTVKGSATPGTDYVLLSGTKKIKAGKTSKVIKIIPEGDLGGASKKTIKLTLASGDGYTVGTPTFVKVKIVAAAP